VALESLFITSTIDIKERRKVVTIDIPGAFLHANNDDCMIMKMVGMLTELMVKTIQDCTDNMLCWRKGDPYYIYNCRRL
jgi:hypothetical protein